MDKNADHKHTVIKTARGLTISGTRITVYAVVDYLKAGWQPTQIRDRLNLSDRQISDVMEYIEAHRSEVEAEYELVLQQADNNRKYWEKRNRKRFSKITAPSKSPDELRAILNARQEQPESV